MVITRRLDTTVAEMVLSADFVARTGIFGVPVARITGEAMTGSTGIEEAETDGTGQSYQDPCYWL